MAVLIKVKENGNTRVTSVEPKNGKDFKYTELREFMNDANIQIVHLFNGELMVVDEEGKLKGLPVNDTATSYAIANGLNDTIAGNALICKAEQIK